MNGYFEYLNGNKYLTLVPTDESKEKIKKYKEMWIKIRDLIRSMTKISDDYDEKYMIIKFNSDEKLPPNKTIEIPTMKIIFQWRIWGVRWVRTHCPLNIMCPFLMKLKFKNQL